MDKPHTEQAVRSRCLKEDIVFPKGKRGRLAVTPIRNDHQLTWNEQQETLLQCLLTAKKAPDLEEEIRRLNNIIAALKNENKILLEKTDCERRYNLAIQQGNINPPLPKSNFTEHIALYDPKSISEMPDLPNISESAFCFS